MIFNSHIDTRTGLQNMYIIIIRLNVAQILGTTLNDQKKNT